MEEDINHVFLDLDSTVWYWDELTEGAEDALKSLNRSGVDLRFFTDNTLLTSKDYARKLTQMSLDVTEEQVLGVEKVLGDYLREKSINDAYVLGNSNFINFLSDYIEIDENSDNIIVGFDQQTNYQKIDRAFQLAGENSKTIICSKEKKFRKGSQKHLHQDFVNKTIENSSKAETLYLGKASKKYRKKFRKHFTYYPTNSLLIGDSKEDIILGNHLGMTTALITTGDVSKSDFKNFEGMAEPDYGISHLGRLRSKIL